MAKAKTQPQTKKVVKKKQKVPTITLPEKENYIILVVGVIVIIVGYILMDIGGLDDALSLVIAPIVLIVGYCIIIPIGILYRKRKGEKSTA